MTTDPQTAADAADETRQFLTAWINAGQPNTIAVAGGYMLTVPQLGALLADCARMATELEQAKRGFAVPVLRQAWRNGWSDRARAVRDAVRVSDSERDAYERAFARYMSEDPAEADKDPYRPLDGPGDPAASPTWDAHRAAEAEKGPQGHAEDPAPSPRPTPGG